MSNSNEMIIEARQKHKKDVKKYLKEFLEKINHLDLTVKEKEEEMQEYLKKIDDSLLIYESLLCLFMNQ